LYHFSFPFSSTQINDELGLAFDDWDLDFYCQLFKEQMKRNPTDVECFDMAQSNSEHSRHWFFGGKMVIDGEAMPHTLFQLVKQTLTTEKKSNSVIAFHDNSSSISGYPVRTIQPQESGTCSKLIERERTFHPILTAETHNFPSGVAPFPGAETGTGGRIRDVQATGTGAMVVAGVAAYCVGNLRIPGYELPWEEIEGVTKGASYPANLASPLQIQIQASNGASDYGNKFGEPVVTGFTRAFGMRLPSGERREWLKPIMFSAGIGQMDSAHAVKGVPEKGMWVVKLGGPCYRIGMGGGAASSRVNTTDSAAAAQLDFDAVQRGDAEMENKMNRVIRACVEMCDANPIVTIHDQGAGGNGNVLKEICEPAGAVLEVRALPVADETLSVLEIWGAEYQENCALLLRDEHTAKFLAICKREKVPGSLLGQITGDGRVVLTDSEATTPETARPVDLDLQLVLADMPQKTFESTRQKVAGLLKPLELPAGLTVADALDRVLRLVSVGSKRFLTNKVDRSVTGLVAQQQCVGPLHLPLADVAVIAQSHFYVDPANPVMTGIASSVGEAPIKGLIDPKAMARLTVGESLTNLVFAKVTLGDVKASGNWMWAAKMEHEGAAMYDACEAMRDVMLAIGVAIDGGKDSLSMAARVSQDDETVKAPGALVLTCYAACPDVSLTVTPDLKLVSNGSALGETTLLLVDLSGSVGAARLGGSALAQVFGQLGEIAPDLEDPALFASGFGVMQELLSQRLVLAGHDRSDGGLLVTVLEMAFAGTCGVGVELDLEGAGTMGILFAEELGLVLEVNPANKDKVLGLFAAAKVPCVVIGKALPPVAGGAKVVVKVGGKVVLDAALPKLHQTWEATSFELERLQSNPKCVEQEERGLVARKEPQWTLSYTPSPTAASILNAPSKPRVAIVRQEGSNGDREMSSAWHSAGFESWDVSIADLVGRNLVLDGFHAVAFVGGFSYADVMDSAKGWAGAIRFNPDLWAQFEAFRKREDTVSLGVCNGCQLMALLGWVPALESGSDASTNWSEQPRFVHNDSGRFESRFSSVKILPGSPASNVMLKGMEGSSLGVWVAHGEGQIHFPSAASKEAVVGGGLAPIRYVDDDNKVTEEYPFNPNGSVEGIAGLCSKNGRHLALMPHPERVFQTWQWPWMPREWQPGADGSGGLLVGPWLQLFQNARSFVDSAVADDFVMVSPQ
jgi:phosphoribosylformylglycinamidine synthase